MNDQRIVQALVEAHQKNPNKITIGIEFERNDFSGYGDYMSAPMTTSYMAERSFYIGNQELPFYDGFEENFNSAEHIPVLKFLVEEAFPQEAREARHSRKDRDGIEEVQQEFQNQLFSLERKFRMASGSEILRNLEQRIAQLENRSANRVNWSDLLDQANDVSIRLHFDLMVALEDLADGERISDDEVRYAIARAKTHLKNQQASRSDKNKLQNILDALQSI